MKGNWTEIKVVIPVEALEAVEGIFYSMDVKGLSIEDPKDILSRNAGPLTWDFADINLFKEGKDNAVIKAYFPDTDNVEKHIEFIKIKLEELEGYGIKTSPNRIEHLDVNEEDWANSWKKYYKPIKVGEKIVIKPIWENYDASKDEIIIEMDPGMAFGTGTHETTRMCIELLEKNLKEGMEVADVGTGSGILGIVSSKLGASHVTAVDLDPVAVDSARINMKFNNIFNMDVIEGNITEVLNGKVDILIANIIADVVMIIAEDLPRVLKKGGYFIASGIIDLRLEEVVEKFKSLGLEIIEAKYENDWRCLICRY